MTWIPHKEHDGTTEEDIKFPLLSTVHNVHHHKPPILDQLWAKCGTWIQTLQLNTYDMRKIGEVGMFTVIS